MSLLIRDYNRLPDSQLRVKERKARGRLVLDKRVHEPVDLGRCLVLVGRAFFNDDIGETASQLFALGADHGPELAAVSMTLLLFLSQKILPCEKEVPMGRRQVLDEILELVVDTAGLARPVVGE